MNSIAQRPKAMFSLQVLNGPDKGAIYQLVSHSIKLGRDPENDISLAHDPKCSRQHAVVSMNSHGVEVRNISDKNTVLVDGREITAEILSPNSVIQLGDTKLKFKLNNEMQAPVSPPIAGVPKKKRRKRKTNNGPSPLFYTILVVLAVLVYFLMNTKTAVKEESAIRTEEDILNQIEENRKISNDVSQAKRESGQDTREFREAQAAYIKGFRDYQKGQFERAKGHFQTCLAINPSHPLCGQALINAQTKFSELVQYYLRLGYDHQRKNQFKQCKNAFRNVQIMQKDKASTIYKEAEAGFKACDSKEKERF